MTWICLIALLSPPLQETETREVTGEVRTHDQSNFKGTFRLPALLVVKTKYGEMKIKAEDARAFHSQDGTNWLVVTWTGSSVSGEMTLPPLEIRTEGGSMTVQQADIASVTLHAPAPPPPTPQPSPPPAAENAPPAGSQKFPGHEFRKKYAADRSSIRGGDVALLLSSGKAFVLLDPENKECLFVDTSSLDLVRVSVDAGPVHLVEKKGKLYVACREGNSLVCIDADSRKATGKVSVGSPPLWLSSPELADEIHVLTTNGTRIDRFDLKTGKMTGVLLQNIQAGFITALPDARWILTQSPQTHSPSAKPELYFVRKNEVKCLFLGMNGAMHVHADHDGPFFKDVTGARLYAGKDVYTLDARDRIATLPCYLSVPHPTANLVFGAKRPGQGPRWEPGTTILIFQEDTLGQIEEIDIGDRILALVPSEQRLFVIGETRFYVVELRDRPCAAQLAVPRTRRIPFDPSAPSKPANLAEVNRIVDEGQDLLDDGKCEEARKKFETADAKDPLGSGRAGIAMTLVREKKFNEAVDVLTPMRAYPFRNLDALLTVYTQLGIALAQSNRLDDAIRTFQWGLQIEPEDVLLLENLGVSHAQKGQPSQSFLLWSKAVKIDPKKKNLREKLETITKELMRTTAQKCPTCEGAGRHEYRIEEEGSTKKVIRDCKTCEKTGTVWRKPCLTCSGSGRKTYYESCDLCWGGGYTHEPLKGK